MTVPQGEAVVAAPQEEAEPPFRGTRLRAMDALRLVAALAVVLFHFTARDHMRWGSDLTMLQDLFGVRRVDGVYWTLWIEMQFYLLMLGLLIWGVTTRRVLALAA